MRAVVDDLLRVAGAWTLVWSAVTTVSFFAVAVWTWLSQLSDVLVIVAVIIAMGPVVALMVAVMVVRGRKAGPSVRVNVRAGRPRKGERLPYTEHSAKELVQLSSRHLYLNHWMRFTGVFQGMHADDEFTVVVATNEAPPAIVCRFEPGWREILLGLRLGDEIRLSGQIVQLHAAFVTLESCELTK